MNANAQAYLQYQKTSLETKSPGRLLLMLFEGAIKNLNNSKIAITNHDYNQAHESIMATQEIVVELMTTLKMEYDISTNLMALYEYFLQQLIEANLKKDVTILDELLDYFVEMHSTWEEAIKHLGPTVVNTGAPVNRLNISG